MFNNFQAEKQFGTDHIFSTAILASESRRAAYERNRHRVYAIAFWMTGNELLAEDLTVETFCRAFMENASPSLEEIDQALLQQLQKQFRLPIFTLSVTPPHQVENVRTNTLRIDLERAVIALPATEKLIFILHDVERYDHDRIARLIGITGRESHLGLHQARLRIRELLAR